MISTFLKNLRFPYLFAIAAIVLVIDLIIPDLLPFADEILLAAATGALAMLRKRRAGTRGNDDDGEEEEEAPPPTDG